MNINLVKLIALLKVSSIAARVNIEPKIGPMQGVQPKPNARPIKYGKKILFVFFASNLFSKFKKLDLISQLIEEKRL